VFRKMEFLPNDARHLENEQGGAPREMPMIGNAPRRAAIGAGTLDGLRWIGQHLPKAITRPEGSPAGRGMQRRYGKRLVRNRLEMR
jgi:hypothetical protein